MSKINKRVCDICGIDLEDVKIWTYYHIKAYQMVDFKPERSKYGDMDICHRCMKNVRDIMKEGGYTYNAD